MDADIYTQHWLEARADAEIAGLKIVEHGWEQHVIIDEPEGIVYRYPRHASAAAKLADEVAVLHDIHSREWPAKLPVMIKHNDIFTSYKYIVGEILNETQIATLTSADFDRIGSALGELLYEIHSLPHSIIEQKKTKHTTTLLAYYVERIEETLHASHYPSAHDNLAELKEHTNSTKVVTHGDIHGLNIVIDPIEKKLNGVIDLSEMEIGDPNQDFRKLFMTDERLLEPAIAAYEKAGGTAVEVQTARLWAYVNEWANISFFASEPDNPTYQRAWNHLRKWHQI